MNVIQKMTFFTALVGMGLQSCSKQDDAFSDVKPNTTQDANLRRGPGGVTVVDPRDPRNDIGPVIPLLNIAKTANNVLFDIATTGNNLGPMAAMTPTKILVAFPPVMQDAYVSGSGATAQYNTSYTQGLGEAYVTTNDTTDYWTMDTDATMGLGFPGPAIGQQQHNGGDIYKARSLPNGITYIIATRHVHGQVRQTIRYDLAGTNNTVATDNVGKIYMMRYNAGSCTQNATTSGRTKPTATNPGYANSSTFQSNSADQANSLNKVLCTQGTGPAPFETMHFTQVPVFAPGSGW